METKQKHVPPPPPSKPPPINYVPKNAPANASRKYSMSIDDDDENRNYQINVNSPYRVDAVATPPRPSRRRQDRKKMSNIKVWISKSSGTFKNRMHDDVLSKQRDRIQELELKLSDRQDQMKLLEFQHPFISKDKDHFPDFDEAFGDLGEQNVDQDEEDEELFVDPAQNEESFQTLNYSIDTLAHLHGLEDFTTDDGESGLLRQESIEDVMRNRPSVGKPTILDSGSAIDKLKTPLRVRNYETKLSPTLQRGGDDAPSNVPQYNHGTEDENPTMATLYEQVQNQHTLGSDTDNVKNNLKDTKVDITSNGMDNNGISPIQNSVNNDDKNSRLSIGSMGRPSIDSVASRHRLSIGRRPSFGSDADEVTGDHFADINASFDSYIDNNKSSVRNMSLNGLELVASDVGTTSSKNTLTIGGINDDTVDSNIDNSRNEEENVHCTPKRSLRRAYGQNQYAYNGNSHGSSINKRHAAVPTPGLSPILSSNESDSRGEISFTNTHAEDISVAIDKKISRSLTFGDIADMRQQEGNANHEHSNGNRDAGTNATMSTTTSEIVLPGGMKSQSTLLFRGDTNSHNLPDFEGDTLQRDNVIGEKSLQIGDLSSSISRKLSRMDKMSLKGQNKKHYLLDQSYKEKQIMATPGLSPILGEGDHRLARRQRSLIMDKHNLSLHLMSPVKESPSMLDLSHDESRSNASAIGESIRINEMRAHNQDEATSSFRLTSPVKETSSMVHLDSTDSSSVVEDGGGSNISRELDQKTRGVSGRSTMRDQGSFAFRSRADNYGTYLLEAQRFGVTNLDAQWEYARLLTNRGSTHRRVPNRRFSFERDCYEASFISTPTLSKIGRSGINLDRGTIGLSRTSKVYSERTKTYKDPLRSMFEVPNGNETFSALGIDPTIKKYSTHYWGKRIAARSPSGLKA